MYPASLKLSLVALAALGLAACRPAGDGGMSSSSAAPLSSGAASEASSLTGDQALAEAYIRTNIATLSPEPPVLGGSFYVLSVEWTDEDSAVVTYEDGHIQLTADAEVTVTGDEVTVASFEVRPQGRAEAKEGEMCGGIAGFRCARGLTCRYDGDYPDAAGVCVAE